MTGKPEWNGHKKAQESTKKRRVRRQGWDTLLKASDFSDGARQKLRKILGLLGDAPLPMKRWRVVSPR